MSQYQAVPLATARPVAPIQFTPALDQSKVSHLRVTIESIKHLPDGGLYMAITCGEIGFRLLVPAAPNRPGFAVGQRYTLEYPKGQNPLVCQYTAIYPADQKPALPAPQRSSSMNTLIATNNTSADAIAMSSREIADLLGSRHDKVKQSIERLAERGVIQLPPMGEVENNQSLSPNSKSKAYIFKGEKGKRDSIIVVAQLSPEFTARLVDRWQELEAKVQQPAIPQTLPEALRLAADLAEQLTLAAPKAAALDRIATIPEGSLCITDAAKTLGMNPKALFKWLSEHQWIYRRAGSSHWIAYQHRLQTGVLDHKITTVTKTDGAEKIIEQVLVTAKGIARLGHLLQALPAKGAAA